jgi:HlyD family secretion protein
MLTSSKKKNDLDPVSTTGSNGISPLAGTTPTGKTLQLSQKKRKKRLRTILIVVGCFVMVIVLIAVFAGGKKDAIVVQTEKVGYHTVTEEVQATGKIQPQVMVKVSPEVPGEIIELPFKEGDRVKKGDLIAKIKPLVFQEQFDAAQASYNSAKAQVEMQRATMIQDEANLKRGKMLNAEHLMSDQDYDAAKAAYASAVAAVNAADFTAKAAEGSMKQLQESLNWTSVLAPMDGVITSLLSQLGETVVGTASFAGTEIMDISDLAVMNAMVDVDENDVVNVKIGDSVKISIDAFPDRTFTGKVIEIANSAKLSGTGTQDQSTNFTVKVRLDNFGSQDLRPGMSCTARIQTQTKPNVLAVPLMAVTRRDNEDAQAADSIKKVREANKGSFHDEDESYAIVFIVKKDTAKSVTVKTGISDNNYVEILSGLKGGEEVIKGNFRAVSKELEDGKLVKVDNSGTTATAKD